MQKHKYNFNERILEENKYEYTYKSNLTLSDKIVSYYNGQNWRIVPLDILIRYPIIYDKYYNDDKIDNITDSICPFTLACCSFIGKYYPSEYILNSSLILTDKEHNLLPIVSGYSTNSNNETIKIKRLECNIKIFRNAISDYPDCQFINIKDKLKTPIINLDYYFNKNFIFNYNIIYNNTTKKIHPKTLIYVVQYKSSKSLKDKYSIIVGKDANNIEPTGYNTKKSGLVKYLESMKFKFNEKSAFLIPQLWFSCFPFYHNVKIVYL